VREGIRVYRWVEKEKKGGDRPREGKDVEKARNRVPEITKIDKDGAI